MRHNIDTTEPVGIVISQGRTAAVKTAILAYEWGPAPELDIEIERVAHKAA